MVHGLAAAETDAHPLTLPRLGGDLEVFISEEYCINIWRIGLGNKSWRRKNAAISF